MIRTWWSACCANRSSPPPRTSVTGTSPTSCTPAEPSLRGDQLLVPYGVSDSSVRFAFVDVPLLLDRLIADGPLAGRGSVTSAQGKSR